MNERTVEVSPAAVRLQGRVAVLRPTYGFITGDDGIDRMFLPGHLEEGRHTFETLTVGRRVAFTSVPGREGKGPRASRVVAVTDPARPGNIF